MSQAETRESIRRFHQPTRPTHCAVYGCDRQASAVEHAPVKSCTSPTGQSLAFYGYCELHLAETVGDRLLSALQHMLAAAKCHYDPVVALSEYGAEAEEAIQLAKSARRAGTHPIFGSSEGRTNEELNEDAALFARIHD